MTAPIPEKLLLSVLLHKFARHEESGGSPENQQVSDIVKQGMSSLLSASNARQYNHDKDAGQEHKLLRALSEFIWMMMLHQGIQRPRRPDDC